MAIDYTLLSMVKQAGKFDILKALFKVKPAINNASDFVKNTFRPGPAVLKKELSNTARVYVDTPYRPATNPAPDTLYAKSVKPLPPTISDRIDRVNEGLAKAPPGLVSGEAAGVYSPMRNTAWSSEIGAGKRPIMRHELTHASQANSVLPNSLSGLVRKLEDSEGRWPSALGRFLGEVHANAAMSKSIPGKLFRAARFAFDPRQALAYSHAPGYGGMRYAAIHGGLSMPAVLGAAASLKNQIDKNFMPWLLDDGNREEYLKLKEHMLNRNTQHATQYNTPTFSNNENTPMNNLVNQIKQPVLNTLNAGSRLGAAGLNTFMRPISNKAFNYLNTKPRAVFENNDLNNGDFSNGV